MVTQPLIEFLLNPFFLISVIFWVSAFLIKKLFEKKPGAVTFLFPLLFMMRTKKLNRALTKVGRRFPRFWKAFFSIGVAVGFCFMVFGIYFLTSNLLSLIFNPRVENVISPLIPGVTVDLPTLSYLVLPILVNLTLHEFAHAIAATAEKGKLSSSGLFGIGVFFVVGFGAFVELEDLQSRAFRKRTRLRAMAAGGFVNAIIAGITFLMLNNFTGIIAPNYGTRVERITTVVPNSAGGFNEDAFTPGEAITAIEGIPLDLDRNLDLRYILANQTTGSFAPGEKITVTVYDEEQDAFRNRSVTLGENPNRFVGFEYEQVNETTIQVTHVYTPREGGNNAGVVHENAIYTTVNGRPINYGENYTLETITGATPAGATIRLGNASAEVGVNVDYYPLLPDTFLFDEFYLGFTFTPYNETALQVAEVYAPELQGATLPQAGDVITTINGSALPSSDETTVKTLLETELGVRPGDDLRFGLADGTERNLRVTVRPVYPVLIGIDTENYWMPKNAFGRALGGTFPTLLMREFLYFWIISFSLTLFNMLPIPVFDGDRMFQEFLSATIGTDFKRARTKNAKLLFDSRNLEYHFPRSDIQEIHSVKIEYSGEELQLGQDYELLDTTGTGIKDTISFRPLFEPAGEEGKEQEGQDQEGEKPKTTRIANGTTLVVDYEYWEDAKRPLKRIILNTVRVVIGTILLGNFILSFVKFGISTFWI